MSPDSDILFDGPTKAKRTIVLAHGAGSGMDTPFMDFFAKGLADQGFRVVRFEFPYMAAKRRTGKSKPPDREPVLRESWLKVIEKVGADGLVIGGKSMGGRIASLIADEAGVAGLICLGCPFHPVGKGGQHSLPRLPVRWEAKEEKLFSQISHRSLDDSNSLWSIQLSELARPGNLGKPAPKVWQESPKPCEKNEQGVHQYATEASAWCRAGSPARRN